MKILFDGRIYQAQKAGGINRYFAEIISGLPSDWEPVVTGVKNFGENIPRHKNLATFNAPRFRPSRFQEPYYRKWWCPRIARTINLLHPTYYDLTCGFKLADFKCPVVTTVYDMVHAVFPKQMYDSESVIQSQRESVLRANRIVCISKSTERALLELIPEAAGKTMVIYLGSSFPSVNSVEDANLFERPTFIFVGGRGGYKNFLFLLRAFAKAASVVKTIQLEVAGAELTPEERWQMHFLGITDRVHCTVYPDEKTLQALYRKSVALLYPSRYEGFGIPPLEAMSCGTIPVTANTSSLPEVMGDAGIMLDPTAEDAWADCMVKLARPFAGRDQLLERGCNRVKQFRWEDCVGQHVEVYKSLIR